MESIDLIEIYGYRTSKDLVSEKEEIKCNNMIKRYKNDYPWWCYKRKHKKHNSYWPQIPDHPYFYILLNNWRLCIRKNKFIFNLISQQPDIDKIYLYTKDSY